MNPSRESGPSMRLVRLCALFVVVVACWQARDVTDFAFVDFDDDINIVINPHLGPPSASLVQWAFGDITYMRRYLPLGWIGLAQTYAFSGLSPHGYHAVGLILHLVNSVLVFAVLLAVLRRFAAQTEPSWQAGGATLGALWWAVHPFRAETIGWASGLLYEQAGFFALLAALAYLQLGREGGARAGWLALSGLLYTASMLSYPMSLGLIGVFVAIDWLRVERGRETDARRLVGEKLWLVVPALAVLTVTLIAQLRATDFWGPAPSWDDFGLGARLQQAGMVWGYYVLKPWWPTELTPVPTWLVDPEWLARLSWSLPGMMVVVSGLFIVWRRRWPEATALWFAHAALLAPMFGFNDRPHFAADRYHYLAGVVWAGAVVAAALARKGRRRTVLFLAGLAAAAALAKMQSEQLAIWQNTDTLMTRIVAQARHWKIREDYAQRWARHHANRGDRARAQAVAARARVTFKPDNDVKLGDIPPVAPAHLWLALDFWRRGWRHSAREHFRMALRFAPAWSEAAYHASLFFLEEGNLAEAWRWCQRAGAGAGSDRVPLAAGQRLMGAVAEAFHATGRTAAACGLLRQALRVAEAAPDGPGIADDLRAQLRHYQNPANAAPR